MNLQIHNPDQLLGQRGIDRIRAGVARQLQRFEPHVPAVELTVVSVGHPASGLDKECRLIVRLHKMDAVVVSVRETSATRAVDRAVQRAQRSVERKLQKNRFLNRDSQSDFSIAIFN